MTKLCSESNLVGITSTKTMGRSRLLPCGPCSSETSSARTYIPYPQTLKFYKFQVIKFIIQEKAEPKTESTNILLILSLTFPR